MSVPTLNMVKEDHSRLISIMLTPVGTPAMADIDRELTPFLNELSRLNDSEQHPAVTHIFEWLVHPQRTVEEFNYVVGPLANDIYKVKWNPQGLGISRENGYPACFGQAALEALAVKCPILEGSWAHSLWMVMRIMKLNEHGRLYGNSSIFTVRLTAWIIHVIGNADICPNAYLRIELMCILNIVSLDKHNQRQAAKAVMSACSALSFDYLSGKYYGDFSMINFNHLFTIFETDLGDTEYLISVCLSDFSKKLSKKLNEMNTARISSRLHDVSSQCELNHVTYSEPRELQSLVALLETTSGYARSALEKIEVDSHLTILNEVRSGSAYSVLEHMRNNNELLQEHSRVYNMFILLMINFKECYRLPQLINPTAMIVMDVLELIIIKYANSSSYFINSMEEILHELLTDSGSIRSLSNSPIVQEIISRYGGRLLRIRDRFSNDINFDSVPTIYSLLNHA